MSNSISFLKEFIHILGIPNFNVKHKLNPQNWVANSSVSNSTSLIWDIIYSVFSVLFPYFVITNMLNLQYNLRHLAYNRWSINMYWISTE